MKLEVLVGFDRSGTSMVGGLLAKHPDVAYFFQPFNRTEVHATQYEVWDPGERHPATERFVEGLLEGRVERDYLGAELFDENSTAAAPSRRKLNVVKDTKLHFKAAWLRQRFPGIGLHGIWREPRAILASLARNRFLERWYGRRALDVLRPTIESRPELEPYRPFLARPLDLLQSVAVVVAARQHLLCLAAPTTWIHYEDLLADPNATLDAFTSRSGLAPHDYAPHLGENFNVSGAPPRDPDLWRTTLTPADRRALDPILAPLTRIQPHPRAPAT